MTLMVEQVKGQLSTGVCPGPRVPLILVSCSVSSALHLGTSEALNKRWPELRGPVGSWVLGLNSEQVR